MVEAARRLRDHRPMLAATRTANKAVRRWHRYDESTKLLQFDHFAKKECSDSLEYTTALGLGTLSLVMLVGISGLMSVSSNIHFRIRLQIQLQIRRLNAYRLQQTNTHDLRWDAPGN